MEKDFVEKIGGIAYVLSRIGDDVENRLEEYEVFKQNNQITEDLVAKYVSGFLADMARKTERNLQTDDFLKKVAKQFFKDYVAEKFFGERK